MTLFTSGQADIGGWVRAVPADTSLLSADKMIGVKVEGGSKYIQVGLGLYQSDCSICVYLEKDLAECFFEGGFS